MSIIFPFLVIIFLITVVLGIVAFKLKKNRPTDYSALFGIGIVWLPFGLLIGNYVLAVLGVVFLISGLANRKKWKENRVSWSQLSEGEKKLRMVLMIILLLLVVAGLAVWYLTENGLIS